MYRFLLTVAFALTVYSSAAGAREIVSDYLGPTLEHVDSRDEGLKMCKKAHVLGFYKNHNSPPSVEMLSVMMKDAEVEDYC